MVEKNKDVIYYLTLENENYTHPPIPKGVEPDIIKGLYKVHGTEKPTGFALVRGNTYVFDQSDSTNASYNSQTHPLMFSTGSDGDHNGNGHYMSGVQYKLDGSNVDMSGYTWICCSYN